jgi:hypothetical protein
MFGTNSRECKHEPGNEMVMTVTEEERYKGGTPRKTIAEERIWNKRPDVLAIKIPTSEKL